MKKIIAIILTLAICLCGAACGGGNGGNNGGAAEITMNRTSLTVAPGTGEQLYVDAPLGAEVKWTSDDEAVATVSDRGFVTGVSIGETNVTAEVGGKKATCLVAVKGQTFVPVMKLSVEELTVRQGDAFDMTATVTLEGKKVDCPVQWTSDNTAVATVNGGRVTGVGVGTTTVKAAATYNGTSLLETVEVKVVAAAGNFFINEASISLAMTVLNDGDATTTQLNYTSDVQGLAASDITWDTENDEVATVDNTGNVTSVGKGECRISATAVKDGVTYKAYANVEVYKSVVEADPLSSAIEVQSDDKLTVPAATFTSYTHTGDEDITAIVCGKSFSGKLTNAGAEITTDGTVYGEDDIMVEVRDRIFKVPANITAKLVSFKIIRQLRKNGSYQAQSQVTESMRLSADPVETLKVYKSGANAQEVYLLNTNKAGKIELNPDGTTELNLLYEGAMPIGTDGKAFIAYGDRNGIGSDNAYVEYASTVSGQTNAYKFTDVVRRTYFRIVCVDQEYLTEHNYDTFKVNFYQTAGNLVGAIYNSDLNVSGELYSFNIKSNVDVTNGFVRITDLGGTELSASATYGSWYTAVYDLTGVTTVSSGCKSIDITFGCDAGASFYLANARFE